MPLAIYADLVVDKRGPAGSVTSPDAPASLAKEHRVGFNTALWSMCWLSRNISAATWFKWDVSERGIHNYVLFWLVALSLILAAGPTAGPAGLVVAGIVFYRLQEVIFSTLDNALVLTDRGQQRPDYAWQTLLMLALVNIVQIVLIFAIAYLVLTGKNPGAFGHPPTGRFGEFFLSWISLPPLGGGAEPLSTTARVLTIGEEATGLLIIVIAISRFLAGKSSLQPRLEHRLHWPTWSWMGSSGDWTDFRRCLPGSRQANGARRRRARAGPPSTSPVT